MSEATPGLFESLRRLATTFVSTLQTRIELLKTELDLELRAIGGLVLWALVALLSGAIGVAMLGLVVIFAFPEQRLLVAAIVAVVFLAISGGALLAARAKARSRPRLSATLEELRRDREALERR